MELRRCALALQTCLFPAVIDDLARFEKDDVEQGRKLDELDLDAILNTAEDHDTVNPGGDGGASLGGDGFLAQFASVSDVKNDLNWEDIIPLEDRQKFEKEEEEARKAQESAAVEEATRKRTNAQKSYQGMDVDEPPSTSAAKKPKTPAPVRKTASQKAMELKERDVRVLVRSLQRWGDIRLRYDTIVSAFPHARSPI
jgi:chromodomain-helicase-DNA-binding protein 1